MRHWLARRRACDSYPQMRLPVCAFLVFAGLAACAPLFGIDDAVVTYVTDGGETEIVTRGPKQSEAGSVLATAGDADPVIVADGSREAGATDGAADGATDGAAPPRDPNIVCTADAPCEVHCTTSEPCRSLSCRSGQPCIVECSGRGACKELFVRATNAASLCVRCRDDADGEVCNALNCAAPISGTCAVDCPSAACRQRTPGCGVSVSCQSVSC